MTNKKGFTAIIVIFVLVALIAGITLVTYLVLTNQPDSQSLVPTPTAKSSNVTDTKVIATPKPVSDSTDLTTIESELSETDAGTPENDLKSVEIDASSL